MSATSNEWVMCPLCQLGSHCHGRISPGGLPCLCGCSPEHTIPDGDARLDMLALLAAAAHGEDDLLRQIMAEMTAANVPEVIYLMSKYVVVLLSDGDPTNAVEAVRDAALYWQGGESPA